MLLLFPYFITQNQHYDYSHINRCCKPGMTHSESTVISLLSFRILGTYWHLLMTTVYHAGQVSTTRGQVSTTRVRSAPPGSGQHHWGQVSTTRVRSAPPGSGQHHPVLRDDHCNNGLGLLSAIHECYRDSHLKYLCGFGPTVGLALTTCSDTIFHTFPVLRMLSTLYVFHFKSW